MKTIIVCFLCLVAAVAWAKGYRDLAVFVGLFGLLTLLPKGPHSKTEVSFGFGDGDGGGGGGD